MGEGGRLKVAAPRQYPGILFPTQGARIYRPNPIVGGNRFFRYECIFRHTQILGIDIQPFGSPLP